MELNIAKLFLQFKEIAQERLAFLSERSHIQDYEIRRLQSEFEFLRKKIDLVLQQNREKYIQSILDGDIDEDEIHPEEDSPF
tara:strand:- start:94 stop:339 length:246 start_codon:yes stop_codon:yes gene_type:complete